MCTYIHTCTCTCTSAGKRFKASLPHCESNININTFEHELAFADEVKIE